ncbi:hypothetical protein WG899_06490 [Paucibacter sp. AS339]|uniref:hypothetical protein n=1 Tax=Paucibacter hankyongi TaxID=3133434 RepID=UPI0030A6FEE0
MKLNTVFCAIAVLLTLPLAGEAAIVQNGSFENPLNTWVNTSANYMAVADGSTAITSWAVTQANGRGVAWAMNPTNDSYFASAGSYFVDLSGFGVEAGPNAALEQTLQNLIAGQTYTVGIDYWGDPVKIAIGGTLVATAGSASYGWSHLSSTFTASGMQELISIGRGGSSGVAFVDNLTVSGPDASNTTGNGKLPEPGSFALVAAALLALGGTRSHRARHFSKPSADMLHNGLT